MKTAKTLVAAGIASAMIQLTACNHSGGCQDNPLLQESELPFGAPDFSKIKTEHYLPAIEAGIAQQREIIENIVKNEEAPTFENTILAFEESDVLLNRVKRVFIALTDADKTPEISEIEKKVLPMLTELENDIAFNKGLFQRIKEVYDHQLDSLQGEDRKLTEEIYKEFVRNGALLSDDKMERMKQINMALSDLQQQWGDSLQAATNDAVVWVDTKEELAGLSEADIAQCKQDAENRGNKKPYCIVIVNTTQQQLLASLDNRDLRRRVFEASVHRADGTGKHNTYAIVTEMARLRAEQAALMGYQDFASYSLEKTMAKTTDNVYAFLKNLIAAYTPKADAETRAIEQYAIAQSATANFSLQHFDSFYY